MSIRVLDVDLRCSQLSATTINLVTLVSTLSLVSSISLDWQLILKYLESVVNQGNRLPVNFNAVKMKLLKFNYLVEYF